MKSHKGPPEFLNGRRAKVFQRGMHLEQDFVVGRVVRFHMKLKCWYTYFFTGMLNIKTKKLIDDTKIRTHL